MTERKKRQQNHSCIWISNKRKRNEPLHLLLQVMYWSGHYANTVYCSDTRVLRIHILVKERGCRRVYVRLSPHCNSSLPDQFYENKKRKCRFSIEYYIAFRAFASKHQERTHFSFFSSSAPTFAAFGLFILLASNTAQLHSLNCYYCLTKQLWKHIIVPTI